MSDLNKKEKIGCLISIINENEFLTSFGKEVAESLTEEWYVKIAEMDTLALNTLYEEVKALVKEVLETTIRGFLSAQINGIRETYGDIELTDIPVDERKRVLSKLSCGIPTKLIDLICKHGES